MTPNEIYTLDDLAEKPWYAFKKNRYILSRLFPVLWNFPVDFDRAKADGNNRFSLCLKIRTPVKQNKNLTCWALMFDGRPFGFFTAYMYLKDRAIFDFYVYITDLTLRQAAEDLVCSYVNELPSDKPVLNLPVLASDQTLVFKQSTLVPAFVDGMVLVVPGEHQTQDKIVLFNALVYHRLLNELIKREGEKKTQSNGLV